MLLLENLIICISFSLFSSSLILTIIIIFNFKIYNNKLKILINKKKELENINEELNQIYQYYIRKMI
jgi:hypothetical protein